MKTYFIIVLLGLSIFDCIGQEYKSDSINITLLFDKKWCLIRIETSNDYSMRDSLTGKRLSRKSEINCEAKCLFEKPINYIDDMYFEGNLNWERGYNDKVYINNPNKPNKGYKLILLTQDDLIIEEENLTIDETKRMVFQRE